MWGRETERVGTYYKILPELKLASLSNNTNTNWPIAAMLGRAGVLCSQRWRLGALRDCCDGRQSISRVSMLYSAMLNTRTLPLTLVPFFFFFILILASSFLSRSPSVLGNGEWLPGQASHIINVGTLSCSNPPFAFFKHHSRGGAKKRSGEGKGGAKNCKDI